MGNPLAVSDEDFLNGPPPPEVEEEKEIEASAEQEAEHDAGDPPVEEEAEASTEEAAEEDTKEAAEDNPLAASDDATPETPPVEKAKDEGNKEKDPEGEKKEDEPKAEDTPASGSSFSVPSVIKANGKDIEIRSEAEAVQLMQMGANFTRKMQEIAPHRKTLMMLQNNGLMDENKLSFLIDLEKGDPEAIKKFLKDKNVDLNEIDMSDEPKYLAGNHIVGDDEAGFRTVLDEISSTPAGKETITVLNNTWDTVSKEVLWKNPELMNVFHEQRQSGVYDQITAEMDRRKALGSIAPTKPFLEAYKEVGEELMAEALKDAPQEQKKNGAKEDDQKVAPTGKSTPIATRAATPKATVANGDKASAASASRSSPSQAKTIVNPLSMSDDEFMKQMEGRV